MATERTNWDDKAHRDLIGAIADEMCPSQEQLRGVVNRLHQLGYTCTLKAVT
jgi:hypothetical protein